MSTPPFRPLKLYDTVVDTSLKYYLLPNGLTGGITCCDQGVRGESEEQEEFESDEFLELLSEKAYLFYSDLMGASYE